MVNLRNSIEEGISNSVSDKSYNGHHNGNGTKASAVTEKNEKFNETNDEINGKWEAPRPKKRGRKPGSGAALRMARREAAVANGNIEGDNVEVRRRKRETEVLVGEQIRRLRLESGLSQEELGRSSHMSTSYISRLETNEVNPTVDALNRIVRVFGLTIDGLLGLDTNSANMLDSEELDPEIRVWLFKLKGKTVSSRTKHIIQVVIEEELKDKNREIA